MRSTGEAAPDYAASTSMPAPVRAGSLVAAALLAAVSGAPSARGAAHDHLRCRPAQDQSDGPIATVEVSSLPFGLLGGCTVKRRVREVCEVASADTIGGGDPGAVSGEPLQSERLCYRIRCENVAMPVLEATDRFGTRPVELGRSSRICVPAAPPVSD